jgi:hypothetical protein
MLTKSREFVKGLDESSINYSFIFLPKNTLEIKFLILFLTLICNNFTSIVSISSFFCLSGQH